MRQCISKGKVTFRIVILIIALLFSWEAFASIEFHSIEVYEFHEKKNDEFFLIFKSLDEIKRIERSQDSDLIKLHIRFNAKCVTSLIQSEDLQAEKENYLAAVLELREQISKSKKIVIGLKSGKGFHKIPNKINEYQCDNLAILDANNRKIVYAVHSDLGSGYCGKK